MKSYPLLAAPAVHLAVVLSLLVTAAAPNARCQVSFFTPPTYVGTGTLFEADFNGDGKPDLLSSDGTLQLGNGNGTFTTGTPVPGKPLAVADFNGDGKADVLEQGTDTLLVLLGNGDGTFQKPISTNIGTTLPTFLIVAGDLNGDGKADVVGVPGSDLLVFLGKGDGTFEHGVPYKIPNLLTDLLMLGDFNGDKKMDVAVFTAINDNTAGPLLVFLGNGDGTFQSPLASTGVLGLSSAVAGDFNGDGKLDLVVSAFALSGGLDFLFLPGKGDGTFGVPTVGLSDFTFGILAAADLNGDHKLDLVLGGLATYVYLGNGDGTFSRGPDYLLIYPGVSGPAVGDFNLDGKADIAGGNYVLIGKGDGTLEGISATPIPVAPPPTYGAVFGAATGDFANRGVRDVAALGYGGWVGILLNDGTGHLTVGDSYTLNYSPAAIVAADLKGDGNLDLVVTGFDEFSGYWAYYVLLGNGDGHFQAPARYEQTAYGNMLNIALADFNHDRKADIAVSLGENQGKESIAVLLGNGDGTFSAPAYLFVPGGADFVFSDDFNGDGMTDLAASGPSGIAILLGNGDGSFQEAKFVSNTGTLVGVADVNGDGEADLVVSTGVLLGNGDGTFKALIPIPQGAVPLAIADFNGDGKLDLVGNQTFGSKQTACCYAFLGGGDGSFGSYIPVLRYSNAGAFLPLFVLATDMNNDGNPDLVVPSPAGISQGLVSVLLNTVRSPADFTVASKPGSSTSQTISAGQTASFNLAITPTGSFSGTVSLGCAITPAVTLAPVCTVPASVNVAQGTAAAVTVKVSTTAATTAESISQVNLPRGMVPIAWTIVLLGSGLLFAVYRRRPGLGIPMIVVLLFGITACGGGGSMSSTTTPGTPAGTYTATVTAKSGSLSHNTALTVIVQ